MKLIASVLQLNLHAVKTLRITDPYSLHSVVYGLYPDVREARGTKNSESSGILYADQGNDGRSHNVLLLADRAPAPHAHGDLGVVRSKEVPIDFLEHKRYRFKVIVNPVRRSAIVNKKTIPVLGRDAIGAWFMERAASKWGFRAIPENLQIDRVEVRRFPGKHAHEITLAQAHVQGHLEVIDRDQFRQSFSKGIGRGRSFGCGLLQIVPVTPGHLS